MNVQFLDAEDELKSESALVSKFESYGGRPTEFQAAKILAVVRLRQICDKWLERCADIG